MATSLTPFPYIVGPVTNVSPLTYRDASTFLEELSQLSDWLNNSLVPETDAAIAEAVAAAQAGIANAEATITEAKTGWAEQFTEFMANVAANIGAINDAVMTEKFNALAVGKLNVTDAAATYQTKADAVAAKGVADSTYETQTHATATYATKTQTTADIAALNTSVQNSIKYKADSIVFNLKQKHLRRTRAALGKVAARTGFAKIAFVGDSTVLGAYGGETGQASWPARFMQFLGTEGYASAGTGLVPCFNNYPAADSRIVFFGGQNMLSYFSNMTTNNSTVNGVQFITTGTGETGTSIHFYYDDMSAPFDINVDQGPRTRINPTGTNTIKVYSVTGLADTTHEAIAWRVSGTMNILGFELGKNVSYGIKGYNAGISGAKSDSLASNDYRHVMQTAAAASGFAADTVFIMCETNDSGVGTPVNQYTANLQNAINTAKAQNADVILVAGVPNNGVNLTPYTDALYSLATTNDIPLIDLQMRWGTWAEANNAGLFYDNAHPNAAGYADVARAIYTASSI